MKKRLLALLLSGALILSLTTPVLAENDPTEPPAEPQQTETVEKCECGLELGHDGECTPAENDDQSDIENNTDTTNEENVNGEGEETPESCACGLAYEHEGDCQLCECGKVNNHADDCDKCDCGLTKNHEGDCAKCDCGLVKNHDGECAPKVGNKIWIKSGSKVYKSMSDTDGHTLILFYHVTIEAIEYDENGAPAWYKFSPAVQWFGAYQYVKVESTTNENPEQPPVDPDQPGDEKKCSCGSEDGVHTEGCPLYDENMGEIEDNSVVFSGESENVDVSVIAEENVFPEGTIMQIEETEVDETAIEEAIEGLEMEMDVLGIYAVDISFDLGGEKRQPAESVVVSLSLPAETVPEGANMMVGVHMGEEGPEVLGTSYLKSDVESQFITLRAEHFSSYVAVFVNGKYNAQKMSSVLQDNARYEVATFNVDLFDYDPVKLNTTLNSATTDGNGFHLTGYGISGMGSNNGINNSASTHAKQGILQNQLVDGFPVINFLNGTDAGKTTGKILFSDTYAAEGKTVYNDIPFEFIYDKDTGYYQYKSSANHAQLNEAGNKIELYADTLSTENNYVATLDLNTANGESDFGSITKKTNSFKATASDINTNNRIDPYVIFTVDNVKASDVGQIYVKAKVPADVGTNAFQLFFTTNNAAGWDEAKSFGNANYSKAIPYTANGDWIEFVIDTSENSNWKDTITAVRVDLFDSNKGTMDVTGSYSIEIGEIRFIKKDYDAYATRGGFYPFSEVQDSYPGNNTAFSLSAWESLLLNDGLTMARASRSIFNPAPSSETLRYNELAFGTVIEFDFYLPVNKSSREDLTYYFNGDDDLWVFVDNQLVLDIGGGHGAITGKVNFSTGAREVEAANTVSGYNSGADGSYAKVSDTISDALMTPGKHTMKIFYLERGGSVSNCFMKFNLPQTPEGALVVEKKIEEVNGLSANELQELYAKEYTFTIDVTNKDTTHGVDPVTLKYTIEGVSGEQSVENHGTFTLKADQVAAFDIPEYHEVEVAEVLDNVDDFIGKDYCLYDYQNTVTEVIVDGKPASPDEMHTTTEGGSIYYKVTNRYKKIAHADLVISKIIPDGKNPDQSFQFVITDASGFNMTVVIPAEKFVDGKASLTIANLPVGEYTVTEDEAWSWRYTLVKTTDADKDVKAPWAETDTNETFSGSGLTFAFTYLGEEVTFTNERTEDQWLDGEAWAQNIFDGNTANPTVNGDRVEWKKPDEEDLSEQSEG